MTLNPRIARAPIAALLAASAGAPTVHASVTEVFSVADATLYQPDQGNTNADGAGPSMFIGRTVIGDRRRALLRFDVTNAIPAGSTITSVTLRLQVTRANQAPQASAATLHRVTSPWTEGPAFDGGQGGQGAAPSAGDVTWLASSFGSTLWTTPGGDFEQSPLTTAQVGNIGGVFFQSTAALVANVQSWLDAPQTNFGWIIIGNEATSPSAKRFQTREGDDEDKRPKLIIEFTPPGNTQCNDVDVNNDGSLFDPQDIDAFLSVYSEGPCVPSTFACDGIDFNNDGSFFDPCDISSFLTLYSEGPCTPCGV